MNTRFKHEHKIQTWTQVTNINTRYEHEHKIKKMNAVYKVITRYKHDVINDHKHTINKKKQY